MKGEPIFAINSFAHDAGVAAVCEGEVRFALLGRTLRRRVGWQPRIVPVPHHLTHAANAFYLSPFDEAVILVTDGFGDDASVAVFHGRGTDIRQVYRNRFFDSLGMFYAAVTLHLGWRTLHDEGTVMALAATGSDRFVPQFHSLIEHFYRLTGVPMVINTSFNRRREPIVHSPADAVRTFCATGLDLLFLGDVAAWKPHSRWAKSIRAYAASPREAPLPAATSQTV